MSDPRVTGPGTSRDRGLVCLTPGTPRPYSTGVGVPFLTATQVPSSCSPRPHEEGLGHPGTCYVGCTSPGRCPSEVLKLPRSCGRGVGVPSHHQTGPSPGRVHRPEEEEEENREDQPSCPRDTGVGTLSRREYFPSLVSVHWREKGGLGAAVALPCPGRDVSVARLHCPVPLRSRSSGGGREVSAARMHCPVPLRARGYKRVGGGSHEGWTLRGVVEFLVVE